MPCKVLVVASRRVTGACDIRSVLIRAAVRDVSAVATRSVLIKAKPR